MSFRTVGRFETVWLTLAPWGGWGQAPRVRGRAAVDAEPGTWPTGVKVDGALYPRLRESWDETRYAETVWQMIVRVAELTGTSAVFELQYA